MSMQALMEAVRDKLRRRLNLRPLDCEIVASNEGMPVPMCGEVFYAVHEGQIRPAQDYAVSRNEYFSVRVTISLRGGRAPLDRWGPELMAKTRTGIYARAAKVIPLIHGAGQEGIELLNEANERIRAEEGEVNGFLSGHPLICQPYGPTMTKSGTWWSAGVDQFAGMALPLTFTGAQRIQLLD